MSRFCVFSMPVGISGRTRFRTEYGCRLSFAAFLSTTRNPLPSLDPAPPWAQAGRRISRPGGRSVVRRGGKSGLHGEAVPDNLRRGRPQGQCHREQTALPRLVLRKVRVKGCGKSAPRTRQRGRHGKPHREQDRIGATRSSPRGEGRPALQARRPGWLLEAAGNGRPRGMAATSVGSSRGPYRTRLTGRLIHPIFAKSAFHRRRGEEPSDRRAPGLARPAPDA